MTLGSDTSATDTAHGFISKAVTILSVCMEVGVLLLVCLSPWAFGAVEPEFEFVLYVGLAVLLGLWGIRILLEWRIRWAKCPVELCLAGVFLVGTAQLTPLPTGLLRSISPTTSRLYERLSPTQSEVLPFDEERLAVQPPTGSTLSLYPAATRRELMRVLAVFLLFALVRNNVASPQALWRFSLLSLANGTLLAYLGLAQFFSSPSDTVYWTLKSPGQVFGPFINRNHFAFYVNVCIGLGVGLVLYTYSKILARNTTRSDSDRLRRVRRPTSENQRSRTRGTRRREQAEKLTATNGGRTLSPLRRIAGWSEVFAELIGNPKLLWISAATAVMGASTVFCLSRGGFLALLGAAFGCVSIRLWSSPRFLRLEAGLLAFTMAVGLLVWFGLDQVRTRLESVWTGVAFEESRKELWSDILPIAKDFPLIGSGYGTFQYVEPLYRIRPSNILNEHAHNEYLEALIEGGLPRLGLMALAIWFTLQLGFRALVRLEGSPLSGLVMGALFGCAAAVIHSVGEFGIHVPAIAIIVAVLAAHLCALGSSDWTSQTGKPAAPDAGPFSATYTLRLGGLAPVTASAAALLLGVSLVSQSWTAARVQLFRRAAWSSNVVTSIEDPREREILYLGAAARLAPDYARLQVDLAQAQQDAFEEKIAALEENAELDDVAIAAERERLTRVHLVPALRHYLCARDLCPLLGQPHLRIAENVQSLDAADPATDYLDRAKLLIPFDPELWYICGVQELFENQPDKAWKSWRHSLELSDLYFSEIVRAGSAVLGTEGLLTQVLPEKPALLARAADLLYPNSEDAGHREPLLSKAQALLRQQPSNQMDAEQWHIEAIIARSRKQVPQAIDAYRAALATRPTEVEWRYELADLLFQGGKIDESHRELVTILRQRPDHNQARQLYAVVSHQRAVQR